jgi:hypothetical protein
MLIELARPMSGFLCDRIGTLIRHPLRAKLGLIGPVLSSVSAMLA